LLFFSPGTKWKWDIFTLNSLRHQYLIYFLCPCIPPSSVQSLSHVQLFASPWTAARQASLSITNSRSLLKLISIKSVMPSNHLILCHPLLLLSSIFPSIFLFQWVCSLHQVAKVLELQLQHLSFQWIFRTDFIKDWLVWSPCRPRDSQESSPAPQFINSLVLSFLYSLTLTPIMTTGKTIALTRWTFVVLPAKYYFIE